MYIGRFAPSPTGPLHFGSLVAAVGSYLDARAAGGKWLLRIEDVDAPRTVPGAAETILRQLSVCGFEWDGEVLWQHDRIERYREALNYLRAAGHVFGCACSRKEIADSSLARDGSKRYPGTCRNGVASGRTARAWRVKTAPGDIVFQDRIQGPCSEDVFADIGDFVLLRADGQFAYQLAVVVDDGDQGVTHIVRGADLLDSTARQIFIQRLLGMPTPAYAHLPVVLNDAGEKLSKQTLAAPFDYANPAPALINALRFLGQIVPADFERASLAEIWRWAIAHWEIARVPPLRGQAFAGP